MIGIGPASGSAKPNLINELYQQGKIDSNTATLYLGWTTSDVSKLDIGVKNSGYIKDDWHQHSIYFESSGNYEFPVPSFSLSNVTYNDTTFFKMNAPLVPMGQSPYVISFGTDYQSQWNAFVSAFTGDDDSVWTCSGSSGSTCQST